MGQFVDLQCASCGKRYGYYGKVCPPCPSCGNHPPDTTEDDKLIAEFKQYLLKRKTKST